METNYLKDKGLLLFILSTALFTGLLAGSYPAVFLSQFQPIITLKESFAARVAGINLRKGLVVFQFVISTVLIIGTFLVQRQLEFIRNKNLGFNQELLVVIPYSDNEKPLITELLNDPNVQNVSVSQRVPVNNQNSDGRMIELRHIEEPLRVESFIVDERFLDTYQMKFIAGRNFSRQMASDTGAFIINKTAAEEFGWSSPQEALGKEMTWSGYKEGRVIGVIDNFHTSSLYEKIEPAVLQMMPNESWWRTFISVRINSGDIEGTLSSLESVWRKFSPQGIYDYFFIDESLAQLHRADKQFGRIFASFAALAIIIACLGLFGLISFTAEQRTKEIGVRKVLGATVTSVIMLLSKEFVKLVIIANLIAWPIAYYAMNRWLQNFAYRTSIGMDIFLLSAIIAGTIAIITVSYHAIKAAIANPVKSLRYE